jgi:hypothetical protein
MLKILNKTGIYSLVFSILLIIIVFCAGCSDDGATSTPQQTPAITTSQVKFVEGDIIAKSATSSDVYFVIMQYDATTDRYERAFINKKSDGSWERNSEKSEFADRDLVEKVYPAKVGHVNSLSQISVDTQANNVPLLSTSTLTQTPTSQPTKTQTLSQQVDSIIGTWTLTNTYDENGTKINVICTHQFMSSGNFSHFCAGPGEPTEQKEYGQWENLGDNSYVIKYPNINNPEQPYGFYEGFYYNLSYNPRLDTLTIVSEIINESVVLTRAKN